MPSSSESYSSAASVSETPSFLMPSAVMPSVELIPSPSPDPIPSPSADPIPSPSPDPIPSASAPNRVSVTPSSAPSSPGSQSESPSQPPTLSGNLDLSPSLTQTPTPTGLRTAASPTPLSVVNSAGQVEAQVTTPRGLEGTVVAVVIPPSELPPSQGSNAVQSEVVSVTITNSQGVNQTQFPDNIEICIRPPNATKGKNICLGYLEETTNPPRWRCQDNCLQQKNRTGDALLCGSTDHLTNFALLLGGGKNGGGPCESGSVAYITGSSKGDLILSLCMVGAAILCVVCIVAITSIHPKLRGSKMLPKGAKMKVTVVFDE